MLTLVYLFILNCPETQIINNTVNWSLHDTKMVYYAKRRCREVYPEAPCLVKFIKKETRVYNAICGGKR